MAPKDVKSQQYSYLPLQISWQLLLPQQMPKNQSRSPFRFPIVAKAASTPHYFLLSCGQTGSTKRGSRLTSWGSLGCPSDLPERWLLTKGWTTVLILLRTLSQGMVGNPFCGP